MKSFLWLGKLERFEKKLSMLLLVGKWRGHLRRNGGSLEGCRRPRIAEAAKHGNRNLRPRATSNWILPTA